MRRTTKSRLRLEELERRDVPTATVNVFSSRDGSEGERDGLFTLYRDQTAGALTVQYVLTTTPLGQLGSIGPGGGPNPPPPGGGGGPTNSPVPGSVTFADGEEFADVVIAVPDTNLCEWDREVALSLTASFGYLVSQSEPDTLVIFDDEPQGDYFVDATQDALEGVSEGYVRLRRWDASAAQTVTYAPNAASTAVSGVDFAPVSGSLAFAVGQATADVVIDPTGQYDDPADEADVFVGIDFNLPGNIVVSSDLVEIADRRAANQPPAFQLPLNQASYAFLLGERAAKDVWVGETLAVDPDAGNTVTYSITAGNGDGFFRVDEKGWIRVAKNLTDATALSTTLTVKASDGRGGDVTVQAKIDLKPMVLISGDLQGVEANVGTGRDTIRLDFHRFSRDVSAALAFTFRVDFNVGNHPAVRADLANPNSLTADGQNTREVTFGPDCVLLSVTLTPAQDNTREFLENFTVRIEDGAGYVSLLEQNSMKADFVEANLNCQRKATVSVIDAVTLFARENEDANLQDPADTNVNINDARQGNVPDCFFIAGVAAMAQRTPDFFTDQTFLKDNGDGTATVGYYPTMGGARREVTVAMTLDRGLGQAQLSEDYFEGGNERAYEIWPQILEKAYAQIIGWNKLVGGDRSAYEVWQHFTGEQTEEHLTADLAPNCLQVALEAAVTAGKKVVLSSWWNGDEGRKTVAGAGAAGFVAKGHAYVLLNIQNGFATFYNPWGSDHPRIPVADLAIYFYRFQVQ